MMSDQQKVNMAQSVRELRENMPAMIEHSRLMASLYREKFNALKAVGFTEAQALELCWR